MPKTLSPFVLLLGAAVAACGPADQKARSGPLRIVATTGIVAERDGAFCVVELYGR